MHPKERPILIGGYYGYGNLGDELILRSIIEQIRKKFPDRKILVLSRHPGLTRKTNQVDAFWRYNFFRILLTLRKAGCFVLGGGGLIQDKTSVRSLAYYIGLVWLAGLFHCPVFLYAVGVEAISRARSKSWIKNVFSVDSVRITVRDIQSKSQLTDIGIQEARIFVTADPVFCLSGVFPKGNGDSKENKVALLIPRFALGVEAVGFWQRLVAVLNEAGFGLVQGLCFQSGRDKRVVKGLRDGVEWLDGRFSRPENLPGLNDVFKRVDLVVSARYHGLLLAALCQKPFVGVGDPDKISRLCKFWGHPFVGWQDPLASLGGDIRHLMEAFRAEEKPLALMTHAAGLTLELMP